MKLYARDLGSFPGFCRGERVPIGTNGAVVETDTEDVERLGRWMVYGDAIPRLLATLTDGRVVQIMNKDNGRDVQNWLRRSMKRAPYPSTNRDIGWSTAWGEPLVYRGPVDPRQQVEP